jgi:membrane protein DedA with SNARE-associated domain
MLSSARPAMPDLTRLIDAWGYAAIFLIVVLGNLGLPIPEETVLTVGGIWPGKGISDCPSSCWWPS